MCDRAVGAGRQSEELLELCAGHRAMKPLQVAGDVRLFVLGDEGVLFSETRQELYTLNTAATLLWCLLEEGTSLERMVETYAGTFGLTMPAAQQHVYPMMRRWFGLGHLADPAVPGPGADTVATEVSAAQGLKRLLDESLVLPGLLDRRNVGTLVEWARGLAFYDLTLSSLEAGVRAVRHIAAQPRP